MVYHFHFDNACRELDFWLFAPFYRTYLDIRKCNLASTIVFGVFYQSIFKGFTKIIGKEDTHFAIRIKEVRVYLPMKCYFITPLVLVVHSVSDRKSFTVGDVHLYGYHIVIHKVLGRRIRGCHPKEVFAFCIGTCILYKAS